jgi:hypothetical protein
VKRAIVAFFGIAVAFALLLTIGTHGRKTQEKLPQLAQKVGLHFPADATLIGAHHERGIDELVRLKVEVPESELESFLRGLPFSKGDARPGKDAHFGPDRDFWDPNQSSFERFYEGRVAERSMRLGISHAKSGRIIVYVESFET